MTAFVLEHLLDLHQCDQALDVLDEVLPLVALGIHVSGVPLIDENALLAQAGTRVAAAARDTSLQDRWRALVADAQQATLAWRAVTGHPCPALEEDTAWQEMAERLAGDGHELRALLRGLQPPIVFALRVTRDRRG